MLSVSNFCCSYLGDKNNRVRLGVKRTTGERVLRSFWPHLGKSHPCICWKNHSRERLSETLFYFILTPDERNPRYFPGDSVSLSRRSHAIFTLELIQLSYGVDMKKRSFIITGISLGVSAIFLWGRNTTHSQDVSGITTNAPSATLDSDGDGFTDAQEAAWGTDPHDPNSHPDLITGMVLWLPFDEGQGTQVLDASGEGHNGTLEGSSLPTWTSDSNGASLAFDGTQGEVVVPNSSDLLPSTKFSMMAWLKVSLGVQGTVLTRRFRMVPKVVIHCQLPTDGYLHY